MADTLGRPLDLPLAKETQQEIARRGTLPALTNEASRDYMMAYIVGAYGEKMDSSSTYEILYYRDLLAEAAGQPTWYMDDLYDHSGNLLKEIYPIADKA